MAQWAQSNHANRAVRLAGSVDAVLLRSTDDPTILIEAEYRRCLERRLSAIIGNLWHWPRCLSIFELTALVITCYNVHTACP